MIHHIIFRFYLLKYSLFFSSTLVLTSSYRRSLYTFYSITVSFVGVDVESTTPWAFIGEKVPENGPFRDPFWRGMGHLAPLRGKSHTKAMHWWTTNIVLFIYAKAWLRDCSQRCHLRRAARQGWVCLSNIPFSRCPCSMSAAGSLNLYRNVKLWVAKLNICRSHN